jgi:hypothetical protein
MATRWDYLPGLNDDYVNRSVEDYRKAVKAKNVGSSALRGGARQAVIEAGERGAARLAGRAYAPLAALQGGYEIGRAIDEQTGVGKRMVDESGLGDAAARAAVSEPRVQLTPEAKARIAAGETRGVSNQGREMSDEELGADIANQGNASMPADFNSRLPSKKRGGQVKKMAKGGVTKSSPQRATGYRGYGIAKKV